VITNLGDGRRIGPDFIAGPQRQFSACGLLLLPGMAGEWIDLNTRGEWAFRQKLLPV